jgi:putative transposase
MSPDLPNRRSIRLRHYDYAAPGAYFVTLCVKHREPLFGKIVDGKMRLNALGEIVRDTWESLRSLYPYIQPDVFVVMPDHFHAVLSIDDISDGLTGIEGASRRALALLRPNPYKISA